MANPTTNFGWVMPTSSSLVTNLPADFNTFGQGVDTSMAQLKGGTIGQILSKTSATDMAFTWITPNPGDITGVTAGTGISGGGTSGDVTITNSMATAMTTKGDLVPATGSGTFSRLAVGTNGQTLVADSTASTGLKWATPASGALTLTDYTPTFTNITVGNGTLVSKYVTSGDLVYVYVSLVFGSTTTYTSTAWEISVPVTPASDNGVTQYFQGLIMGRYSDTSAGQDYIIGAGLVDTSKFRLFLLTNVTYISNYTEKVTSLVPVTSATGDAFFFSGWYRKA